ncbi:VOC family protein [Pontivivens ytuae]|uniref:VOC family protein n=1 Tax=Pontivivens ytuae TaxID=2789856 RepID=A0A7S9QE93_9RHOB|nr:VOC family protein [Pontivivens ytuae]QPH55162.1 VOC family protein [Pontivivens ytuae]
MLRLDHLTVIAPTLGEGVAHVRDCLDLDVPFGTRHLYMGTHNHRLQLGDRVYLEIVALDPEGTPPGRARWFGLDDQGAVRRDWDAGRRLRGCVASTTNIAAHGALFGEEVPLPPEDPSFAFAIPADGSLPMGGALPSLIDHRGDPTAMAEIPDLGAQLISLHLTHPRPEEIAALYTGLSLDRPPEITQGAETRWTARIETPTGVRELT